MAPRNDSRFAPTIPASRALAPVRGTPEHMAMLNAGLAARGRKLWTPDTYAAWCAERDRSDSFEPAIECPWD